MEQEAEMKNVIGRVGVMILVMWLLVLAVLLPFLPYASGSAALGSAMLVGMLIYASYRWLLVWTEEMTDDCPGGPHVDCQCSSDEHNDLGE